MHRPAPPHTLPHSPRSLRTTPPTQQCCVLAPPPLPFPRLFSLPPLSLLSSLAFLFFHFAKWKLSAMPAMEDDEVTEARCGKEEEEERSCHPHSLPQRKAMFSLCIPSKSFYTSSSPSFFFFPSFISNTSLLCRRWQTIACQGYDIGATRLRAKRCAARPFLRWSLWRHAFYSTYSYFFISSLFFIGLADGASTKASIMWKSDSLINESCDKFTECVFPHCLASVVAADDADPNTLFSLVSFYFVK